MGETSQLIVFEIISVLLPLVPAFILFWYLPDQTANVSGGGLFKGLEVKFGGAFAGYLVVFLLLWQAKPKDLHHYDTWTVRGAVQMHHAKDEIPPNEREVTGRVIPPTFEVENDGSFAFRIQVPDGENGEPQFPDLQMNVRDYSGVTVHLRQQDRSGYGNVRITQRVDGRRREIQLVEPIVLQSQRSQPPYSVNAIQELGSEMAQR
jgi:hypothetical protein